MDEILNLLPENVADALEDYAIAYRLTISQVLEIAISSFLNLDAVSFGEIEKYESIGVMRERIAILELQVRYARAQGFPALPEEFDIGFYFPPEQTEE